MADLVAGLTVIEGFNRVVPSLLVLLLVYALLEFTKAIGENKALNIFISLVVAILVALSDKASQFIAFSTPWFVVLFFVVVFMVIGFKTLGVSDSTILGVFREFKAIPWLIGFVVLIIAAIGLGQVMGQDLLEQQPGYSGGAAPNGTAAQAGATDSADFHTNFVQTLFHPTILSFILLGLIAAFTVLFMASKVTK